MGGAVSGALGGVNGVGVLNGMPGTNGVNVCGSVNGVSIMERKDSMQQSGLGLGVLDLIERDQRARGY